MPVPVYDVVIVGAGVSGLACAKYLLEHHADLRVCVVEASNRVGGRTLADEEGSDLGAGYIGPGQDHVLRLIEELGMGLTKVYTAGKTVQCLRDVVQHYSGLVPPISAVGTIDLNTAMQEMERLVQTVCVHDPKQTPDADRMDRMTAQEAINAMCWTAEARSVMRTAIRAILCVEPCEVSLLGVLWYIRCSGGTRRIFETEKGAQDSKVIGGVGSIAPAVAERLARQFPKNFTLRLSSPVRTIDTSVPDHVDLTVLAEGSVAAGPAILTMRASAVVLAIAPIQQLRIQFHPALPAAKATALQRFRFGHIMKTFTYYETAFWREKGLNGSAVCDEGIVVVAMDDTKPDGSKPCIMGFVLTDQASKYSDMTDAEVAEALGKHYAKLFGDDRGLRPLRIKRKTWASEPWVGGCYVGVPSPLALTQHGHAMRAAIGTRCFVAGTETARVNVGYVDGAVESGQRNARNVLVLLGRMPWDRFDVLETPEESTLLPASQMPLEYSWIERHLPALRTFILGGALALAAGTWWIASSMTAAATGE